MHREAGGQHALSLIGAIIRVDGKQGRLLREAALFADADLSPMRGDKRSQLFADKGVDIRFVDHAHQAGIFGLDDDVVVFR